MGFFLCDSTGRPQTLYETYKSLIWNVQWYGYNEFECVLPATEENINTLTRGSWLVREDDWQRSGGRDIMRIDKREITFDVEDGMTMKISGRGLKAMLSQRCIVQQLTFNGSVEYAIRKAISENTQTGNRAFNPALVLGDELGITDTFDVQLSEANLGDWICETCKTYGLGWDIVLNSSNQLVFNLYQSTDRTYRQQTNSPVIFSPEYDNLSSSTFTEDYTNYANAAVVGGEGEGDEKKSVVIGETESGFDRYEAYINGSSVSSNGEIITLEQYYELLKNYGNEELGEYKTVTKVEGIIQPNGVFKINEDYFLGDLVQLKAPGVEAISRIIEIVYSEDENGITVVPTFSEWEV